MRDLFATGKRRVQTRDCGRSIEVEPREAPNTQAEEEWEVSETELEDWIVGPRERAETRQGDTEKTWDNNAEVVDSNCVDQKASRFQRSDPRDTGTN